MNIQVKEASNVRAVARSPRWVLASLAVCVLLPSLGISIANVALPTLAEAFSAPFQQVQWVVLAYLLATTTLIVSAGRLGDLMGRRRLLMAGIFLFTLACWACGIAPNLWSMIAARVAQGLGAAVMVVLAMALVGEVVPKARTGSAMGLLGTMSAVGTALGPSLGGLLIARYGWPAIFFANVPLGLLALFLAWRYLPADRSAAGADQPRFDHLGTLLLALTLAAYGLAMTIGRGSFGLLNAVLILATALGIALFVGVEARVKFPLLRLARFRDPALNAGLAMSALVSTVMMATLVVGPFYLSLGLGLHTAQVGALMSVGPIVAALAGVPSGRLVDSQGAQCTAIIGLGCIAAGCMMLWWAAPGIAGYVIPIAILTAGYALFQAANNTSVMADVAPDQRGAISGMLNLSRNLGLITGASAMGAVFAFASGGVDFTTAPPTAVASGMRATFATGFGLTIAALAIAWASWVRAQRSGRFSG